MTEPNRFHFYIMIFMCVVFEHSRNSYCIGKMRVTWHMSSRLFKGFCSTTLKYDDIKGKNATNSLFCFYIFLCIVDAFHNSISKCMQMYSTLLLFRLTIMQQNAIQKQEIAFSYILEIFRKSVHFVVVILSPSFELSLNMIFHLTGTYKNTTAAKMLYCI